MLLNLIVYTIARCISKKKRGTHTAPIRGTGIPLKETGKPTPYSRIA
ncbi:hypothetical protein M2132_001497 [Dysgonomonas sp. PH5-45]|nr:hypothetical protein [Dysgonomonas sp. PH5-45]MDH6355160.1 hypothetical protein [Dysgonomonas sp. PH5-45]MDU1892976.1 hypothetical protein [Dysgonomonas sp.]